LNTVVSFIKLTEFNQLIGFVGLGFYQAIANHDFIQAINFYLDLF